jgi:Icc-related predicted phosphoesterase
MVRDKSHSPNFAGLRASKKYRLISPALVQPSLASSLSFSSGFGRRMLASFGEAVVKSFVAESMAEAIRLENAMRTVRNERAVVVLHYAPIVDTVEGEPLEIFPFLGSSRLAETIDRFKVSAVVHGHAHHGRYQGRTPRGAPVYNVAFPVEKSSGRPYALIKV